MKRDDDRVTAFIVVPQTGTHANGGVESLTGIVRGLRRVRPVMVTQAETAHTVRWRQMGLEVHVWPAAGAGRAARLVAALSFNRRLAALLRGEERRVVHCNDVPALLDASAAALVTRTPLVVGVRDTAPGQRWRLRWRLLAQAADRVVALSADMRDRVRDSLALGGRPPRHVGYIYSVVDPDRMFPVPQEQKAALRRGLGLAEDEFAIAYVGVVNPKKAQLDFIRRAMPGIATRLPNARVHFVGDFDPSKDEYSARCQESVREAGLADAVAFHGFQSRIEDWYRAADVVALASRREGMARCMIEGIACGTPIVSFDVASAREILEEGDCGVVIESDHYDEFVEALVDLNDDPGRRSAMGRRGAALARRLFDPAAAAEAYDRMFVELGRDAGR